MKNAYLIIHNNVVTGTRAVNMEITQEDYEALPDKEQQSLVEQAAWEYADAYPEEVDGRVNIIVSLGLVGCDTFCETDLNTLEEYEALDVTEQNAIIRESFWESVDCHVVFEDSDEEAEKHTNWGYRG